MKLSFLVSALALAIAAASPSAAQVPKMAGNFKHVIAIPLNDPGTKAIAGALLKPNGAGPFPAVIYMGTCEDIASGEEGFIQTGLRDRLLPKGFAVLIVDPYWPREEWQGVCSRPDARVDYEARAARDIYAALSVLRTMPGIDPDRIFVHGVGLGASAALQAIEAAKTPGRRAKLAGVVAISPRCKEDTALLAPALILIGDKDLWASANRCKALGRQPDIEVKIYAGVGHAFVLPFGHHAQHNLDAANDAELRAEAFLAAHKAPEK